MDDENSVRTHVPRALVALNDGTKAKKNPTGSEKMNDDY